LFSVHQSLGGDCMKKIIAISVMFALIAGAVFADTAVSGAVETRFSLAKQMGADGDDPLMGGSVGAAQIRLAGSNTEGTLGGMFRFKQTDMGNTNGGHNGMDPAYSQVYVWWKPIEQVKVFLGIDQDGLFDTADIAGWSFHAGDNDYLFNHHWDFWRQIFPGNWDGFGLALSFYPMPGLDLNLVLPTGKIGWRQAPRAAAETTRPITDPDGAGNEGKGMIPGRLRFSGNYNLDFGKISFVYLGGGCVNDKGTQFVSAQSDNNGMFGLSALITAVEGVAIKVGGSVILTDPDMAISAGLAVAYTGEGFGVKFRAGLVMQGDADMFITANVMPFFGVGEKGQVLVDIGVTNYAAKDPALGWYVTPAYRLSMEGGAFKIGLQLFNNVNSGGNIGISGADYVKWNIPMLLAFNF
jgi:hypothetical protein